MPIALKDNIDTAGTRTTAGSAVFDDRVPSEDAPVVTRLMAAGLCYGALGTDTGGSIRIPGSFCGIVGLKPTYGLVPIRGIVPLTVSLDHCGPMTQTVEDAALMLNAIAGYDKLDIASVERPREDCVAALAQRVTGFRLGLPAYFYDHLDPEVARAVEDALAALSKLTKGTKDVALPAFSDVAGRRNVRVPRGAFQACCRPLFAAATPPARGGFEGQHNGGGLRSSEVAARFAPPYR